MDQESLPANDAFSAAESATSAALRLNFVNQDEQFPPLYLYPEGPDRVPRILGTGRSAVVFLALTTKERNKPGTYYRAIKFLRDDPDKQYAAASAVRFFQEAFQAQQFLAIGDAFVTYHGWGALGSPKDGQSWWKTKFRKHANNLTNDDPELLRLMKHFDLQAPFYVLDLCQGTLHDLLDKSASWAGLPPYSIPVYRNSLISQAKRIADDIRMVVNSYFTRPLQGLSGYEILNAFRTDNGEAGQIANRVRNYAVLELFNKIVYTVAQLHSEQSGEPLAHRDLKPANIFLIHAAAEAGFQQIEIRLADLGYVITPTDIVSGGTLVAGKRGAEYQAPGSQFFRAPEQAELPIEVRIDLDPVNPRAVSIKGSKLSDIQIHDWLALSDLFGDQTRDPDMDSSVFKILAVEYNQGENVYRLELDRPVVTTKEGDLQGQITRSTGFHTDGFSLGAILYDLISGGRNPELFYTYCLASYTDRFAEEAHYSIDDIVEILAPHQSPTNEKIESDRLSFAERLRASQQITSAHDLDTLLTAIQEAVLLQRNRSTAGVTNLQEKLKHFRFRNFNLVRTLLTDRRGVPIPRDILDVIVRCMVRDAEGSYYRRDPASSFQTSENYNAASRIHRRIRDLLGERSYRLPEHTFPESLSSNLLFKLRSMATPLEESPAE